MLAFDGTPTGDGAALVLAHGVGGRQDLPIPFSYALGGAVVTLIVTFVLLGALWQQPRFHGATAGRQLPRALQRVVDSRWFRLLLRLIGLAFAAYVTAAAVFGQDDALNPTPYVVYVLLWVGVPFASLLVGPVYRELNPLRTLHRGLAALLRVAPEDGLRPLPAGLGWWPAAIGLFAFTWLELVAPDRATLPVLRTWFAAYAGIMLIGAALFGSRWFDRGDPFEAYSTLVGQLAPFGRRSDGALVVRNPLQGIDAIPPTPGLVAVVCVLLGSTAFDGFANAPAWFQLVQGSSLPSVLLGTLGLAAFVAVVAVTFCGATVLAGRLGHAGRVQLPRLFAHSVIPIAVGYVVAHYFSLFVFEGQRALILLSDPLGTGADLLGTADHGVSYTALTPGTIATVQVLAVVIGHVLGVVSAHDRAVQLFPRRQALAGQLPLLLVMVGYTLGGLTLLFAG
jgi:type IV secretory pathway VirB2 component (pilin)